MSLNVNATGIVRTKCLAVVHILPAMSLLTELPTPCGNASVTSCLAYLTTATAVPDLPPSGCMPKQCVMWTFLPNIQNLNINLFFLVLKSRVECEHSFQGHLEGPATNRVRRLGNRLSTAAEELLIQKCATLCVLGKRAMCMLWGGA